MTDLRSNIIRMAKETSFFLEKLTSLCGVQIKGKIFFIIFVWIIWLSTWPPIFPFINNGIKFNGVISSKCRISPESARNFLNGLHSFNNPKWNMIPLRSTSFSEKAIFSIYRACQINRINGINTTNRINNGLIDLCKLGSGLIRINMD